MGSFGPLFFYMFLLLLFLFSFWDPYNAYIDLLDDTTVPLGSIHLSLVSFISFLFPNRILSIVLCSSLLILSSSCSKLLLIPLVSFSFQLSYFQPPEFLFGSFWQFLPFYWYSHFIYIPFSRFLLLFLSVVFFNSLTIFKTVDFTSLTNVSNVWGPSGMVSVRYISLWMGYAFLFICMFCNFFV